MSSHESRVEDAKELEKLPEIPGGWTQKTISIVEKPFQLKLPADPDKFLEDSKVQQAHLADGSMPYWPYLWPTSTVMSQAIVKSKWQTGMRALEIGAGIGLVGLAALSVGLNATFSDYDETAVKVARFNALQNGFVNAQSLKIDWETPPPELSFPIIFGCDILYDLTNHDSILNFLDSTLTANGTCWLGDPGRQHAKIFIEKAKTRGYSVTRLDSNHPIIDSSQALRFQLLILERR